MGELTIVPDCLIDEIIVDETSMLLLPGADAWNDPKHAAIIEKASKFLSVGATVRYLRGSLCLRASGYWMSVRIPVTGRDFLKWFLLLIKGNVFIYRKNISITTNARCPHCHKKLELRGEGDKRVFFCLCGHRERLADFEKRRASAGATKGEVKKYLQTQNRQDTTAGESAGPPIGKWPSNWQNGRKKEK